MDWQGIFVNAVEAGIGRDAAVFALAAIGLNIHFGYTGLLNFGQVGFMAVAAYGVAISVNYYGTSMWVGLLVGLGATIVLAILLGFPTLRLRADYLAIVTIAAAEIVRLTARAAVLRDYTGGSSGLTQFARDFYDINPLGNGEYGFWDIQFSERQMWLLLVAWLLVGFAALLVYLSMKSPWGRVLKAIREDEDAARALGKNIYSYKMQSLIFGGLVGALAGFVYSISVQSVQPDTYSSPVTFFAYTVLILGGTARVFGPIVGSIVFWFLLSALEGVLRQQDFIPEDLMNGTQVGQVRFMLVGLALVLLMIYRPQGIFGDKREIELDAR